MLAFCQAGPRLLGGGDTRADARETTVEEEGLHRGRGPGSLEFLLLVALAGLVACETPSRMGGRGGGGEGEGEGEAADPDGGREPDQGGGEEPDQGGGEEPDQGGEDRDLGLADQGETEPDQGSPADTGIPDDGGPPTDTGVEEDAGQPETPVRVRILAGNLTSGNGQTYDEGHGTRIFQGLKPDIVLIQEFNYQDDEPDQLRAWVTRTFGAEFSYYREPRGSIPNGVISRYPILGSGYWEDDEVGNRQFAWARLDIPGPRDLWAVSVHLLTTSSGDRSRQATALVSAIQRAVPVADYLVIGGDFNTDGRNENCFSIFARVVVTPATYPVDQAGNGNTNAGRTKPYDYVLVDTDLTRLITPVTIGQATFPRGLVFDSRVFRPLAAVAPVRENDSDATNMQHMAVVRDFLIPVE